MGFIHNKLQLELRIIIAVNEEELAVVSYNCPTQRRA